jgi:hypothetical protein
MPVAEAQAPPLGPCRTVHIDTGTTLQNGMESVVLIIGPRKHPHRRLGRAKYFQCE